MYLNLDGAKMFKMLGLESIYLEFKIAFTEQLQRVHAWHSTNAHITNILVNTNPLRARTHSSRIMKLAWILYNAK